MKPLTGPTTPNQFDRLPPCNIEAEMCLLASLLLDAKAFIALRPSLSRDLFYQPDHAILYETMASMADAGQQIDALTLRAELARRNVLDDAGGIPYLAQIVSSVPSAAHAGEYARLVRETWVLRGVIDVANEMIRRAYAPADRDQAPDIMHQAMGRLASLATSGNRGDAFQPFGEILKDVLKQMTAGGVPSVPTGFRSIDEQMGGGIGLGEMWLIGARPSMGKSTLVRQIAIRAARAGYPVAFISLEEGKSKIARNVLSAETRIENNRLRRAEQLSDMEWARVQDVAGKLGDAPMFVTSNTRRMTDIRAELTALVSRFGIKLVIVDYLQRIQADGKNDYERASAASLGMSDLIKELGVAGLVPVQLSRNLEQRNDKRPNMSDIRDSGKIEQDADGIIFLHREDYYRVTDQSRADEPLDGVAELIYAKYRDGIRGETVRLQSNLKYQTFDDFADAFGEDPTAKEMRELGL